MYDALRQTCRLHLVGPSSEVDSGEYDSHCQGAKSVCSSVPPVSVLGVLAALKVAGPSLAEVCRGPGAKAASAENPSSHTGVFQSLRARQ